MHLSSNGIFSGKPSNNSDVFSTLVSLKNLAVNNSGRIFAGVVIFSSLLVAIGLSVESTAAQPNSQDLSVVKTDSSQQVAPSNTPTTTPLSTDSNTGSSVSANVNSTSTSSGQSSNVTVNGQSVNVPANGTTETTIGNAQVNISHSQTNQGSATNGNVTSTTVNVQSNSSSTAGED